jgi:hypothetical protein
VEVTEAGPSAAMWFVDEQGLKIGGDEDDLACVAVFYVADADAVPCRETSLF